MTAEGNVFGLDGNVRQDLLRTRTRFYMGVDLGQAQDHTAIVVVERAELLYRNVRDPVTMAFLTRTRYFLRHAERFPLGVPYTEIAEHVRGLAKRPPLRGSVQVVVDATGVGAPVVDLMRSRGGLGCQLVPVIITAGESGTVGPGPHGSGYRVPKRDLMTGLQVAFENEWLTMAASIGLALEVLVEELKSMRARRNPATGYMGMSGQRSDDLVLALALAWWKAKREEGCL